jgi:type IV secretory pathway VirB10-like protein
MTPPSPAERGLAAGVAAIAAVLLLTALFGSAPPRTEAAAPEPTPALAYLIATPTPSQSDVAPVAQQKPAQQATAAPEPPVAPVVAAVEPPPEQPPAPASQIIYQADGSAVLPGGAGGPPTPVDTAQQDQLAADAALYRSLPRAGDPPANPQSLTIHSHSRSGR